jgi:hypothetical protein
MILLSQPPTYWDYRYVPSFPASCCNFEGSINQTLQYNFSYGWYRLVIRSVSFDIEQTWLQILVMQKCAVPHKCHSECGTKPVCISGSSLLLFFLTSVLPNVCFCDGYIVQQAHLWLLNSIERRKVPGYW